MRDPFGFLKRVLGDVVAIQQLLHIKQSLSASVRGLLGTSSSSSKSIQLLTSVCNVLIVVESG
jgi:hypothetical protein